VLAGLLELRTPLKADSGTLSIVLRRVVAALDHAGMVVDFGATSSGRQGISALCRVEQQYFDAVDRRPEQPEPRNDAESVRRQLLGNAIEYYFITLAAGEVVAPALSRVPGSLKAQMASFILEEYRHDLILAKALEPYGLTPADLTDCIPLPYTAAVTNQLFHLSHNDPLSLMASLFVLEGNPAEGRRYLNWLQEMGAPEQYIDSHREHDRINVNGQHGLVSRRFFREIEYVSEEDEARIAGRVLHFADLVYHRTLQMIDYYDNCDWPCPRTREALWRTSGLLA
jgi:hypothetical protein